MAELVTRQGHLYVAELAASSARDKNLRIIAVYAGALSAQDALAMPDGLRTFMEVSPVSFETPYHARAYAAYFESLIDALRQQDLPLAENAFIAIGQHVMSQGKPPWIRMAREEIPSYSIGSPDSYKQLPTLDRVGILGVAVVLCIAAEAQFKVRLDVQQLNSKAPGTDYMRVLFLYLRKRLYGTGRNSRTCRFRRNSNEY